MANKYPTQLVTLYVYTCRVLVEEEDLFDLGGEDGDNLAEDGLDLIPRGIPPVVNSQDLVLGKTKWKNSRLIKIPFFKIINVISLGSEPKISALFFFYKIGYQFCV
jgi:hypothetical protein